MRHPSSLSAQGRWDSPRRWTSRPEGSMSSCSRPGMPGSRPTSNAIMFRPGRWRSFAGSASSPGSETPGCRPTSQTIVRIAPLQPVSNSRASSFHRARHATPRPTGLTRGGPHRSLRTVSIRFTWSPSCSRVPSRPTLNGLPHLVPLVTAFAASPFTALLSLCIS